MIPKSDSSYSPLPRTSISDDGVQLPIRSQKRYEWNTIWKLSVLLLLTVANISLFAGFYSLKTIGSDRIAAPEDFGNLSTLSTGDGYLC